MTGPIQVLTQARLGAGDILHFDPSAWQGRTAAIIDVPSAYGAPATPVVAQTPMKNLIRGGTPAQAKRAFQIDGGGLHFFGQNTYGVELPLEFLRTSNNFLLTFWTKLYGGGAQGINNAIVNISNTITGQRHFLINAVANASNVATDAAAQFPGVQQSIWAAGGANLFDSFNVHQHAYEYQTSADGSQARFLFYLDGQLRLTTPWVTKVAFDILGPAERGYIGDNQTFTATFNGLFYRARYDEVSGSGLGQAIVTRDWTMNQQRLRAFNG
ncbi:hypothetical protein [Methylobacterium sp. Leaf88]|uniref:hypothetical protein n=1 Tax=Methylobacterium sp. Leaf88 TaxID=1736244 RepID=UPI0006FA9A63|nr:hypothetical protein [Methylobacterium sp. Leaf88]KQO76415.1 hypothetical protein ASF20_13790 [Methylobacterium sp. Leaf88]